MIKFLKIFPLVVGLVSCGSDNSSSPDNTAAATDITNAIFTSRATNCTEYVNQYTSTVMDIGRNVRFNGSLFIMLEAGKCVFDTNAVPNHDFNDGAAAFVTDVAEQNSTYAVTQTPSMAGSVTEISLATDNAILLNGVKLDLLAAACYGVGPDPLGSEKTGCTDINQPFRYDPMSPMNDFGTDSHNAHTQPDGTYHYHGNPNAMFYSDVAIESPVIGFAADGFPIFGSYFNDGGNIRKATSSYVLKNAGGPRQDITYNMVTYSPGGNYDGKFVDDYEYSPGAGDLDECNGMTVDGNYGYYVTDTYPWVLKCYKGTPDTSFNK